MLREPSNLRVAINDVVVRVVRLPSGADSPQIVEIPVDTTELAGRVFKITFAVSATTSTDVCLSEHLRARFVQVLQGSGLQLTAESQYSRNVREFFDRLPRQTTISVSAHAPSSGLLLSAWRMADLIERSGRKVRMTRLPQTGDIVVAPEAEIEATSERADQLEERAPGAVGVQLRRGPKGSYLVIAEPYGLRSELLEPEWLGLARSVQYSPSKTAFPAEQTTGDFTIRPESASGGSMLRETASKAEWVFRFGPEHLPSWYRFQRLSLEVVGAATRHEQPVLLHTYLNQTLIESIRLPEDGQPHRYTVKIPEITAASTWSEFRIVAQRLVDPGHCIGTAASFPIQILPGTAFIAASRKSGPKTLTQAADELRSGFRLYIDPKLAASPEVVPFLARLSRQLGISLHKAQVTLNMPGQKLPSDRPFLLVASHPANGLIAPVRFDRGQVQVVDSAGGIVLHVDHLPEITVAQLAQASGQSGIWIRPSEAGLEGTAFESGSGGCCLSGRIWSRPRLRQSRRGSGALAIPGVPGLDGPDTAIPELVIRRRMAGVHSRVY